MRIVFMGSSEFGIPSLELLLKNYTIAGVVTTPSKPKGRGLKVEDSPIAKYAKEKNISTILMPEKLKDPQFLEQLKSLQADIYIVIAYRILPEEVFSIPRLGTYNVHASLLPKYRGPAPIHRAIQEGEKITGVTVFRIDQGIDTGSIYLQKSTPIDFRETTIDLYSRLSTMGAQAIIETLNEIEHNTAKPMIQSQQEATKAPKLSKDEAKINWSESAFTIYNKIRAFKPFPGTYTFLNENRLGIEWADIIGEKVIKSDIPGKIVAVTTDHFDVQCGEGILRITNVKPEGKRAMQVHDYLLGKKIAEGTVLE